MSMAVRGSEVSATTRTMPFDVERIRNDFPILRRRVHDHPLVYLDNAATAQKPDAVIRAVAEYYQRFNANVHRGVHHLSEEATAAYEDARQCVARFIKARDVREIVFVRGATEAINLVAQSYGRSRFHAGDEILISGMEHHSNIVPWQIMCQQTGAVLRVIPVTDSGEIDMTAFTALLGPATRLVAVGHVSNALGTVNPVREITDLAHKAGALVLIDGAQAVPHLPVDVSELDCDFYAISGHKMFGPTGIGVLCARAKLLEAMPPWQGGGEMIRMVSFERTLYNDVPHKFEAGTPNIAGAVGLAAAIRYLEQVGMQAIEAAERDVVDYALGRLTSIPGLQLIGQPSKRAGVISFLVEGMHPHDLGTIVDRQGVAIRTGHHCAMPLMDRFGIPATARASFAFYNTKGEADVLASAVAKAREVLT